MIVCCTLIACGTDHDHGDAVVAEEPEPGFEIRCVDGGIVDDGGRYELVPPIPTAVASSPFLTQTTLHADQREGVGVTFSRTSLDTIAKEIRSGDVRSREDVTGPAGLTIASFDLYRRGSGTSVPLDLLAIGYAAAFPPPNLQSCDPG